MPKRTQTPEMLFRRGIRGWSSDQLRAAIAAQEDQGGAGFESSKLWELAAMKVELRRRQARAAKMDAEAAVDPQH